LLEADRKLAASRVRLKARTIAKKIRRHLKAGGEQGSSLIEFAVCLPVLMLILTGTFAFGIALNNYLMLTNATCIGAQQLSISRGQTTDPCATAVSAVTAASPLLKSAGLTYAFVLNGASYSGTSCSSSSTTTGAAANLVQGAAAQLTVTYPCNLAVYGSNLVPNCTLKAQLSELIQ
jgi:Flp pilus assembly protein TadG